MSAIYNLSVLHVDGETIYGMISRDLAELKKFCEQFHHEGSSVSVVEHPDDPSADPQFIEHDGEDAYKLMGFEQ